MITVRKARKEDSAELLRLLRQIATLHSKGRPELFIENASKYSQSELEEQMESGALFILAAEETPGALLGYAIGKLVSYGGGAMQDHTAFYLDDLCVDEAVRGRQVGRLLMEAVEEEARRLGCAYVELNVWTFNEGAARFYERNGYTPRSVRLEKKL